MTVERFNDAVLRSYPTGSRHICNPPVMDTDDDRVVLVNGFYDWEKMLVASVSGAGEIPARAFGNLGLGDCERLDDSSGVSILIRPSISGAVERAFADFVEESALELHTELHILINTDDDGTGNRGEIRRVIQYSERACETLPSAVSCAFSVPLERVFGIHDFAVKQGKDGR